MRRITGVLAMIVTMAGYAGAAETVPPATTLNPSSNPQVKRGCDLLLSNEVTQAVAILRPLVDASPTDMTARACYATALSMLDYHEQARQQMSIVLSWKPAWVDGYVVRAVSAGEMGAAHQAKHDLELARQLDPKDSIKAIGTASQRIEKALAAVPKESASKLHAELLKADGLAMDELADRAVKLLTASNAERRLGDEVYSETRRELAWALLAHPKDPDRLAAVGRFILDEVDVRGDSVQPTRYIINYRQQDKVLKEAELQEAKHMFTGALAIKPDHVSSLAGLARMEIRQDMWANAERYLRRAIATGTSDREVLKLMRDVMRAAAAQRVAASISLRMTRHWEEKIGNTVYEYTEIPSAAALAKANNYDAQAANLLGTARDYIRRALTTLANDAASHDFVGSMAFAAKDWEVAAKAWEKAVKLDPSTTALLLQPRQRLLRAWPGRCLYGAGDHRPQHGTHDGGDTAGLGVGPHRRGKLTEASGFLNKAVSVDPGDARIISYMAVIAEAQEKSDEALALYRAAFAVEEAHAKQRGGSWVKGSGYWYVNEAGRPIELRSRIADLLSARHPQQAADLYLQNVNIESWFKDAALKEHVHTAMFPLPNLAKGTRQVAPAFGELMRTNRALAAVELAGLGQCDKAVEHFRKLLEYDGRARTGGANAYQRPRDDLWKSHRVAAAAVKCFERSSDQQQLYGWRSFLNRASADSDSRRFSPTETGTRGRGGWRRY